MTLKTLKNSESAKKKEDIIKAAKHLFLKNGYSATSIRQIVQKAETSIGNCYFYFKNKEEIFFTIANRQQEEIEEFVDRKLQKFDDNDPYLKLAAAVFFNFSHLFKKSERMKLFLLTSSLPDHKLKEQMFMRYIEHIERVKGRHASFLKNFDIQLFASAVTGTYASLIVRKLNGYLPHKNDDLVLFMTEFSLKLLDFPADQIEIALKKIGEES